MQVIRERIGKNKRSRGIWVRARCRKTNREGLKRKPFEWRMDKGQGIGKGMKVDALDCLKKQKEAQVGRNQIKGYDWGQGFI